MTFIVWPVVFVSLMGFISGLFVGWWLWRAQCQKRAYDLRRAQRHKEVLLQGVRVALGYISVSPSNHIVAATTKAEMLRILRDALDYVGEKP